MSSSAKLVALREHELAAGIGLGDLVGPDAGRRVGAQVAKRRPGRDRRGEESARASAKVASGALELDRDLAGLVVGLDAAISARDRRRGRRRALVPS